MAAMVSVLGVFVVLCVQQMAAYQPVVQGLLWRAALKSFNRVPPASIDIQPILDAIQLAPSAFGVQPYDIHVVTDENVKAKLKAASYNQQQLSDCSHLLVFCAHRHAHHSVNRFIKSCNIDNDAPDFAKFLRKTYEAQSTEVFFPWASNQAFIGLGIGVVTAANMRLGSCPMSGFEADKVAEILNIPTIASYTKEVNSNDVTNAHAHNTNDNDKKELLSWPVAYLAIGSDKEDAAWHAKSREVYKRRRVPWKDLLIWHGEKTIKRERGAVEEEDLAK